MIELLIHAVAGTSSEGDRSMVIMKEKGGERILPVMMSTRRAMLLMMRSKVPLPMPVPVSVADLSYQLMNKFGIRLVRVELTAIKDGVFFSRVVGEREGEEQVVDFCQAPDGLVMAVIANCPIMINEELMEAQYMHKTGDNTFALNINTLSRQMLEDALKHAVESENYEAASALRDELAKRSPAQPS
ncbi:MAG: bifunctional nuclease family protein [Bacteroidaceae bacterium]|nr:bifunctional nuclease family protein [Bacteroidaceae bacterium]